MTAVLTPRTMSVPFCDLRLQHQRLGEELQHAIDRVIETSAFILGPEVAAFEAQFAEYAGVAHAIGTSSGTAALIVALKALGIAPGDEVLVPAMTFFATAEAVAFLGATPVFVDIDPVALTIDPALLRAAITAKTKVILPVHLHGQPAAMGEIRRIAAEHGLRILGDAAHAHGATYDGRKIGAVEDIAAFSFYPSKNLGCIGEGGIITTSDDELAERCRLLRDHGSVDKFVHTQIGMNARLDGLNAAVLGVKLPFLDRWNDRRREIARSYNAAFADRGIDIPIEADGTRHVFHVYQVGLSDRARVADALRRRGIGVNVHYPVAMHLHPAFAALGYRKGDFPVAERFAERTLSLPCYPELTEPQQAFVIDGLLDALEGAPR